MNVFFWDLFTWVALDVWLLSESLLLQFAACMCCVGCDVDRGQCRSVGSWRCCCWQLLWRSLQSDRRTASLTHWFVHLLAASLINSHSRPASLLLLLLLLSLDILVFVNIDYCWVCICIILCHLLNTVQPLMKAEHCVICRYQHLIIGVCSV